MGTFILLVIGFVAFFATGIDDTVAYAGSYLNNKKKDHKRLISLGIIMGTIIALTIAILAGSLMEAIPSRHLIGGAVLITLGLLSFTHGKGTQHQKKIHFKNSSLRLKTSTNVNSTSPASKFPSTRSSSPETPASVSVVAILSTLPLTAPTTSTNPSTSPPAWSNG